jgi:hypothetical protein
MWLWQVLFYWLSLTFFTKPGQGIRLNKMVSNFFLLTHSNCVSTGDSFAD